MILQRQHAFLFKICLILAAVALLWALIVMRRAIAVQASAEREVSIVEKADAGAWHLQPLPLAAEFGDGLRAFPEQQQAVITEKASKRFRLVGVMAGGSNGLNAASAIIERRQDGAQRRYRVGDLLEEQLELAAIERQFVWLRGAHGMEKLAQDGSGSALAAGAEHEGNGGKNSPQLTLASLGGRETSAGHWEFNRDAVERYYRQLLDQPERLLKVFDSLAPLYDENQAIEGYRLNIEGEADFFAAIGLQQDDVVRKVNGLEMTNRRRAENLIRRFAQNDLDIVVLEFERQGSAVKQVYEFQ